MKPQDGEISANLQERLLPLQQTFTRDALFKESVSVLSDGLES